MGLAVADFLISMAYYRGPGCQKGVMRSDSFESAACQLKGKIIEKDQNCKWVIIEIPKNFLSELGDLPKLQEDSEFYEDGDPNYCDPRYMISILSQRPSE